MTIRKQLLKAIEVMLGLAPKEEITLQISLDEKLIMMMEMIKPAPYELKLAVMKFIERAIDVAEKEHGLNFTPAQFQEAFIKLLNGNPLNLLTLLSSNSIIKN